MGFLKDAGEALLGAGKEVVKGFGLLLGAALGIVVVKFGADTAFELLQSGIDVLLSVVG